MKQFLLGLVVCMLFSTIPIVSFGSHDAAIVKASDGDHITAFLDHIVITPITLDAFELLAPVDVGWQDTELTSITIERSLYNDAPVDYGICYQTNFIYYNSINTESWNSYSTNSLKQLSKPVLTLFALIYNKLE